MDDSLSEPVGTVLAAASPQYDEAGPLGLSHSRVIAGRFRPGQSGNPGGRKKSLAGLVRERTGDGVEIVEYVVSVLRSKKMEPRLRLQAAEWLADRGFGRPTQSHEISGPEGGSVVFTLQLGERETE